MHNAQQTTGETPLERRVGEDGAYRTWPPEGVPFMDAAGAAISSPTAYRCYSAAWVMNAGIAGTFWYYGGNPSEAVIAVVAGLIGAISLSHVWSTTGQPRPK